MLLHKEKELFREVVISAAEKFRLAVPIVEKDYYVTMILKKLSLECPECVFKGGTSLSKCYHVIDRFSEDIEFVMNAQRLDRTLADKVFAICDYCMPICCTRSRCPEIVKRDNRERDNC